MALATNSAVGDIHLAGDLAGSTDPYNPELTPTGVVPGSYDSPQNVVVNAKGQILYIEETDLSSVSFDDATTTSRGVVQLGEPFFIGPVGKLGVPEATDTSLGVVQVGSGLEMVGNELRREIPVATTTTIGVVSIGDNINVDSSGEISLDLASTTTAGVMRVGNGLDSSSGVVSVDPTEISFPIATTTSTGIMQVGSGLDVDVNGVVSVDESDITYPIATTTSTGIMQVGSGLDVDVNGVVSINLPDATSSVKGGVQIGDNIDVSAGEISVPIATNTTPGVVKPDNETFLMSSTNPDILFARRADKTRTGIFRVGSTLHFVDGRLNYYLFDATTTSKGGVQIGDNIDVSAGEISVPIATNTTPGVVKSADTNNITIDASGGINIGADIVTSLNQNIFTKSQVTLLEIQTISNTLVNPFGAYRFEADFNNTNVVKVIVDKDVLIQEPLGMLSGGEYILILQQDSTGNHQIIFDYILTTFNFANLSDSVSELPNSVSLVYFKYVSGDLYCSVLANFS